MPLRAGLVWRVSLILLFVVALGWCQTDPSGEASSRHAAVKGGARVSTPQDTQAPGSVQELFQRASELMEAAKYSAAIPALKKALIQAPTNA
jgi:Tfp pilus assembly protein PilF